jgi:hypothetical protein
MKIKVILALLILLMTSITYACNCNCNCNDVNISTTSVSTSTVSTDRFSKELGQNISVRVPLTELNGAFFYDFHLNEPLTGAYSEILTIKKTKEKLAFMHLNGGIITSINGKGSLLLGITFKPGLLTKGIRSVLSPFGQALETGFFSSYDFKIHQARYGLFLGFQVW